MPTFCTADRRQPASFGDGMAQRCAAKGCASASAAIEYSATMILDERSAAVFINGYQKLLLEICGPTRGNVKLLERLAEGRKKLMSDVSLLDDAVSRIHDQGHHVDETVVAAATSLQVK